MTKFNKFIIIFTIVIVFGVIIGVTAFKVITYHDKKVNLVESKYIIEKAKRCVYDKVCNESKITLQELYDNGYLEKQVNSITKEYYNNESFVIKNGNEYEFIIL